MAWIRTIGKQGAGPELEALYREIADPTTGEPDNIIRIHSLHPRSMRDHVRLYVHLMRGRSPLTRIQREMVAVTVSALNDCFY